jgi:hypothetical protein
MDKTILIQKINSLAAKKAFLTGLLSKPDLGTLRLDVNQALEELDELIYEFKQKFPSETLNY